MDFINLPLQKLKNSWYHKIWFVNHFNIDIDCIQIIKQLVGQLCRKRTFIAPSVEDLNRVLSNKVNYINDEGIVFTKQHCNNYKTIDNVKYCCFGEFYNIELYTFKKRIGDQVAQENIDSLLFRYGFCDILAIDIKLSEITQVMTPINISNKYLYVLRDSTLTVI